MFGAGVYTGNSLQSIKNGQNNTKGQFYGKKHGSGNASISIFHIENLYGFVNKLCVGFLTNANKKYTVKMTPGNKDGLEGGYNLEDPSQYKELSEIDTDSGYLTKMHLVPSWGMFPVKDSEHTGSTSTYYCEYIYITANRILKFGGTSFNELLAGAFFLYLDDFVSGSNWGHGVSLSYK